MPRKKKDEEALTEDWLGTLKEQITDALRKDCTQKELRTVLTYSYIDFFKGKEIKDGGKIIETLAKIAPAKSDPIESGLEEPVAAVSRADEILAKMEEGEQPVIVSPAEILAEGEKHKLSASVAEPYRQGDTVTYTRETPHDALQESVDEAVTGEKLVAGEERYEAVNYEPTEFGNLDREETIREEIEGEIMTEEDGLSLMDIRRNLEEDRKGRPSFDTMSIPEIDRTMQRRIAKAEYERRAANRKVTKEARREENKRKWAEEKERQLIEARKRREERKEANRRAWYESQGRLSELSTESATNTEEAE